MLACTPPQASIAKRALLLGAAVFASYAYFYQAGGWNQNSRFDLVRAIVEQRTLRIDAYRNNTGDRSLVDGHYYSEKAPGLAFVAVPVTMAARFLLRAAKIDPDSPRGLMTESYLATVASVSLPAAAACACFFLTALRLGADASGAAFASLVMALGTPLWAYATLFWGHSLTASCLVFAFAAILPPRKNGNARAHFSWGLMVGLTAGWATVTEYPAAPASAILAIFAMYQAWPQRRPTRLWTATGLAVGALVCMSVLAIYQYKAFGSLFRVGYLYYPDGAFPPMRVGFLGLTYPKPEVMWELLLGCRRGLLLLSPVLAVAAFGFRFLWRQSSTRPAAIAAISVAVYYFLFNASFSTWTAGWSYGPRYMAPALPFLCIGLAPLWTHARARSRRVFLAAAMFGVVSSLIAVSVTAQPPDVIPCPLPPLLWPEFWRGQLAVNRVSMLTAAEDFPARTHGAFNWGQLLGLHGLASLLPLLVVWACGLYLWLHLDPQSRSKIQSGPRNNVTETRKARHELDNI